MTGGKVVGPLDKVVNRYRFTGEHVKQGDKRTRTGSAAVGELSLGLGKSEVLVAVSGTDECTEVGSLVGTGVSVSGEEYLAGVYDGFEPVTPERCSSRVCYRFDAGVEKEMCKDVESSLASRIFHGVGKGLSHPRGITETHAGRFEVCQAVASSSLSFESNSTTRRILSVPEEQDNLIPSAEASEGKSPVEMGYRRTNIHPRSRPAANVSLASTGDKQDELASVIPLSDKQNRTTTSLYFREDQSSGLSTRRKLSRKIANAHLIDNQTYEDKLTLMSPSSKKLRGNGLISPFFSTKKKFVEQQSSVLLRSKRKSSIRKKSRFFSGNERKLPSKLLRCERDTELAIGRIDHELTSRESGICDSGATAKKAQRSLKNERNARSAEKRSNAHHHSSAALLPTTAVVSKSSSATNVVAKDFKLDCASKLEQGAVLNEEGTCIDARPLRSSRVLRNVTYVPPVSPFGLIQEILYSDPWKVLIACMLLNKTSGFQLHRVIWDFFALCPDAETALVTSTSNISEVIRSLGLQNKRAKMIQRFSSDYLRCDWTSVTELHGIGKYAADAHAIFCQGLWQEVTPDDYMLVKYWEWLKRTDGLGYGFTRDTPPDGVII